MTNRFQEALDVLKRKKDEHGYKYYDCNDYYKMQLDTLQELIDKSEALEKALDKACKFLEKYTRTMYDEGINFKPCIMRNDLWKEYLLKESE